MARARNQVAVLGPGGVGGFLAGMLAREGSSVVILAGDDTARSIGRSGLRIESTRYGTFALPIPAATRLLHAVDACLVTVKATQLRSAVERVPANVLGRAIVVPFLNGIEHVAFLRTVYPPSSVAAATIRIETTRVAPGLIRHTSPFAAIELAASEENRERVESLAEHLRAAGLDVRVRDDELEMLWDKFALIAPIGLLTTHERGNVGAIRTRRREDAIALIGEVAAVARADGVQVDPNAVLNLVDSVPESMESSMQRDQAAGLPLELDALGGTLLRRAAAAGVAVPVTQRLVSDLRSRAGQPVHTGGES
jgi:2-dehydropantoate 2-reductase